MMFRSDSAVTINHNCRVEFGAASKFVFAGCIGLGQREATVQPWHGSKGMHSTVREGIWAHEVLYYTVQRTT